LPGSFGFHEGLPDDVRIFQQYTQKPRTWNKRSNASGFSKQYPRFAAHFPAAEQSGLSRRPCYLAVILFVTVPHLLQKTA